MHTVIDYNFPKMVVFVPTGFTTRVLPISWGRPRPGNDKVYN